MDFKELDVCSVFLDHFGERLLDLIFSNGLGSLLYAFKV